MAQLLIAAAGAVVGNSLGLGISALGLSGAAVGWTIGSILGASFTPGQKLEGPRLNDLKVMGTDYGQVIPWVAGSPRIAGQVIWSSDRRETATTEEVGKGGGGGSYTTYSYDVDLLILLTENQIAGVSRIWSNGEVVYGQGETKSNFCNRITVYTGADDQLPDPTYEAAVGVGNAPAYRGMGSVFIEGLQLGNSGQIPNLTFEVGTSSIIEYEIGYLNQFNEVQSSVSPSGFIIPSEVGPNHYAQPSTNPTVSSVDKAPILPNSSSVLGNSSPFTSWSSSGIVLDLTEKCWRAEGWFKNLSTTFTISLRQASATTSRGIYITHTQAAFPNRNIWGYVLNSRLEYISVNQAMMITGQSINDQWAFPKYGSGSTWGHWAIQQSDDGQIRFYINGHFLFRLDTIPGWHFSENDFTVFQTYDAPAYLDSTIIRAINPSEAYPAVDPVIINPITLERAKSYILPTVPYGLDSARYQTVNGEQVSQPVHYTLSNLLKDYTVDTFEISDMLTNPVRGLAISQISPTRNTLEQLSSAYFFDISKSDKIYFKPRATTPVVTIPYTDLGLSEGDYTNQEPFQIELKNDMELASEMSLQYFNINADYQTGSENSDRLTLDYQSISNLQLPLGLLPSEAKTIVNRLLMEQVNKLKIVTISLPIKYSYLEPNDIIQVYNEDSTRLYRLKITEKTDNLNQIVLKCYFDPEGLSQLEFQSDDQDQTVTQVVKTEPTDFHALDIPALRDVDTDLGFYSAGFGIGQPTDSWPGAVLVRSWDDSVFERINEFSKEAICGVTTSVLGNWNLNVVDELNSVTVNVGNFTLTSATRTDIINSQSTNLCLIGNEIIQFTNAELISTGVYKLTGLLRGRRGTENFAAGHSVGEIFVLLEASTLRRNFMHTQQVGATQYLRAATFGSSIQDATSKSMVFNGSSLRPFSVANLRIDRDTTEFGVKWNRRTKLQYKYTGTQGFIVPLGEFQEIYRVKVKQGSTLLRTEDVTTNHYDYNSSKRTQDGVTSPTTITFEVSQLNQEVGEGRSTEIQGVI